MRSPLELYLLTVLRDSPSTVYDLARKYGLSIGATMPALRRLSEDGLVTVERKKQGRRKRVEYRAKEFDVAAECKVYLKQEAPKDFESVTRICAVALAFPALAPDVPAYLDRAAMARKGIAEQLNGMASLLESDRGADAYAWMRIEIAGAVAEAEAAGFLKIASVVKGWNWPPD